jgi:hypothetical protein
MQHVYLTRRNLLSLISKLDRKEECEFTRCTLVKRDIAHPKYPCTDEIIVTAVEDADYYTDREAGRRENFTPQTSRRLAWERM